MENINYGIIGTGAIAKIHAKAIKNAESARLVAVYDCVPNRVREFAANHNVEAETDLTKFLSRPDIDAVTIATPSGVRTEIAVAAANAGKHILSEKPLEVTVERVDRILEACNANNVILACVFQSRTTPIVQRIRKALDAGCFGKIACLDVQIPWFRTQQYYDSATWRGTWKLDGGGALMNQGIHTIDLMLYFAGAVQSVSAYVDTLTHKDIEVEDTAVAAVKFRNGALGTVMATTSCAPGFPRRVEIAGENGSAVLEDNHLTRWSFLDYNEDDDHVCVVPEDESESSGATAPDAIAFEGHQRQIQDLTNAILTGSEPLVSGLEGRRAVEFICGIYQSARTGQPYVFPGY